MKIVYIDNNDSFADTIASYFLLAGDSLKENGVMEEDIELKMFQSNCDLEVIVNEKPDLIILGSGPNSPKEAGNYLEILDKLHKDYAIFGVCLGMQAMMDYMGEDVERLEDVIHGATSKIKHTGNSFFEGIYEVDEKTNKKENVAEFARYHSLGTYKKNSDRSYHPLAFPFGLLDTKNYDFDILATTPDSNGKDIIMAIEHKKYRFGGVQMHPESILSTDKEYKLTLFENVIKKVLK
jgi:anthranilate/para-aminobenzoate synthase component II|tara:strand:- start:271 stop:981 length:711 start_codon:yes stop_codon:yes gene_type:complete